MRKTVACVAGVAILTSGCTDSAAVETCRTDLESSLKSPSSLKIVDTYSVTTDVDVVSARTEYILPKKLHLEKMRGGKLVVPIHKVSFTYDADNSYGAALRDYHNCTMVDVDYGPVLVELNLDKDPTKRQPSVEELVEQAEAAADMAIKAADAARK